MGQYYKAIILKEDYKNESNPVEQSLSTYDFGNGAKLMEHSYLKNDYVRAVEWLLAQHKEGVPFVWCGDYADEFRDDANMYMFATDKICEETFQSMPLQKLSDGFFALKDEQVKDYKFIINHTKKLYVAIPKRDKGGIIHPLPLLTADGNGRGGGDYHGTDMEHVGSWKYDTISVGDEIPSGFDELKVHFEE